MHNIWLIVHQMTLFLQKYLLISIIISYFAPEFV